MLRGRSLWLSASILAIGVSSISMTMVPRAVGAAISPIETSHTQTAHVRTPRADTENYLVELKAEPEYHATREGALAITVTPKGNYHINPQFPIRFKASEAPEGVSFAKPVMKREDGNFSEQAGGFKVLFTAAKPGKYTLGGTVSISFCSEKNCVMEKIPLDVDVVVK